VDTRLAIQKTLIHEGGFSDNSADPGRATNMGITQADMPGQNMRELTVDQAVAYYEEHYVKPLYAQITDQAVGEKIFDLGVLFGVGTAVSILQLTLSITQDGQFGPNTLSAVNQAEPVSLLTHYKGNLATHAFNVANAKPQERIFLQGWLNRINS
jgi:lysozyme family protein